MKSSLPLFAMALVLVIGLPGSRAFAQATPSAPAGSTSGTSSSLTPEEKAKLMKVRQQVLDSNPDLKAEQDAIKQQAQSLKGGNATPEDKVDFMQKLQDHQQKMKAALLKIDPTLEPLIDKAAAEMKQKFQQRAGGASAN
jgi:hypothetical protein